MLKVGLVGVGGISGAHIPAWEKMENVELAALCDIRKEQMSAYPEKRQYTDFDKMLEEEELDILDICLPTYLHADCSIKAMEKGIHVICEKPISLHKEDVARVYEAAKRNNVKYMVAQVLRFWPEYELLKELYDSKKYGKVLSANFSRLGCIPKWSWDNWMKDENRSGLVPFDLHIHDLDFMVYTFGKPLHAKMNRSKRPDQDYMHVVYEYEDFFVTADASWYGAPYPFSASFRVQFEQAILANEGGSCKIYENSGNIINLTNEAEGDTGAINLPKSDAYANEIQYFTRCVLTDKNPDKVQAAQLEQVLELIGAL